MPQKRHEEALAAALMGGTRARTHLKEEHLLGAASLLLCKNPQVLRGKDHRNRGQVENTGKRDWLISREAGWRQ